MGDTVHAEYSSEASAEPLTVLVDAIAEYKRINGITDTGGESTLNDLGLDRSIDINGFVKDDTTSGELSFWWDSMYVTVHTSGAITVTGDGATSISTAVSD